MGYMRTEEHLHATVHKLTKWLDRKTVVGVHWIQGNYGMWSELLNFVCLYIFFLSIIIVKDAAWPQFSG